MSLVFNLLFFVFCLLIVFRTNVKIKVSVMVASMVLIHGLVKIINDPVSLNFSMGIILITFICLFSKKKNRSDLACQPKCYKKALYYYIACNLLVALFDSELPLFQSIKLYLLDILSSITMLFIGYAMIRSEKDFNSCINSVLIIMICVTFYGLFNYITHTNPYHENMVNMYLSQAEQSVIDLQLRTLEGWGDRYRANATCNSPFYFGYLSNISGILALYGFKFSRANKVISIVGLICSVVIAVICGSRVVLFGYLLTMLFFLTFQKKSSIAVKYILGFIAFLVIAYVFVPLLSTSIDNLISLFTGNDKVGGSSFEMRFMQLNATLDLWMEHPIWGHGFEATKRLMENANNLLTVSALAGCESLIFQMLINQGIISVLFYIIFLYRYFQTLRNYKVYDNDLGALGISVMVGFLIFAIGTGPLGTFAITYFFCGMILKTLVIKKIYINGKCPISNSDSSV